jgi:hypothetical protein
MSQALELTKQQQAAIEQYVDLFREYMNSEQFQEDQAKRRERVTLFQEKLPQRLDDFSEADVDAIVSQLWASRIWGNKDYLAQKIITDNGIDKLRHHLRQLMESDEPSRAYTRFLNAIKGLGPASTTEMLTYLHPQECGIWNRQARDALRALGITEHVNLNKYKISSREYRVFNQLLQAIAGELRRAGIPDVDLLLVDFFLYEVAQSAKAGIPPKREPRIEEGEFDHDEIRDLLADIGGSLGFDTDTEVKVAHGARVDVVWRARIANLGLVTYVFEFHRSGSMDSLILNLQKAHSAPSVQKVVAVSDEEQLDKIRDECEGLPDGFRRALRFWEVLDVLETGEHLQKAMASIDALDLIEGTVW